MYDALQKGFEKSTGEIMAWINSDDIYFSLTLKTVLYLFNENRNIQWLTSSCCNIDENSYVLNNGLLTNTSLKKISLFKKYPSQEATFWKRNLWERAGNNLDHSFKYAGDSDLWLRFIKYEQLYTV